MQTMATKKVIEEQPKLYSLVMQFNGETYQAEADSIDAALLTLKPELLQTEVYLTARKGKSEAERRL